MFELKRTKDYVKRIKEKYPDVAEEDINYILLQGMKNLCRAMYQRMDIRIYSWGVVFWGKNKTVYEKGSENQTKPDQDH
jgi:hypothetical protein